MTRKFLVQFFNILQTSRPSHPYVTLLPVADVTELKVLKPRWRCHTYCKRRTSHP